MPVPDPSVTRPKSDELAWYVVHSRTKAEHVAAAMLQSLFGIETYCPRIRFQRATRRGKIWFVEALFPSYFFARFSPAESLRAVRHSQSVLGVVEFGGDLAWIPDDIIAAIKDEMDGHDIREIVSPLKPGDEVEVAEGPMRGFKGIILSLHNGDDRVKLLLEFLGKTNLVEVRAHTLIADRSARDTIRKNTPKP